MRRWVESLANTKTVWRYPRQAPVRHLPAPDPASAAQLLTHAQARRIVLESAQFHLETALSKVLTYKQAHIEALSYQGMKEHGRVPWAPEAVQLSGAAAWPTWVELLAPLTGTRVQRIDPAGTSTTCPVCGQPCERPEPYTTVICPTHGSLDADAVAARMIRRG